ncbi:hypothetical protein EJB05_48312, partial [Eragrostis curvula]
MLVQSQFQPRADDIILATYPKCGTTWLKALTFTLANRSRHPVTSDKHPLLVQHPQDLVPFLELPDRTLHPVAELEALPSPRLLCTHLTHAMLPSATSSVGCRVVYLCREPKDVLVSLWHFVNKVRPDFFIQFDRAFELFIEGVSLCGPIWDHYLGYWKQSVIEPDRILFLKNDEMMADPTKHVKMLVSRSLVRRSVLMSQRRWSGKVGDWRNHLTEEMAKKLDRIIEEKLKGSGLAF